jgi:serine/threonine protein kinase/tetratricopeptide (TPR) repeat protein
MAAEERSIGPYKLVARLGAGAMGEVWRALDTRLDRMVAIKLLPSRFAEDADRRARMRREAKAAAAVPHANVVALYDIVADGRADALVMELVDGRTVADLVREGPVELRRALDLGIGVCEALAAAHKRGILHRDIKAANVMVTRDGAVKVLDFGLAKLRGALGVDVAPPAATGDEAHEKTPRPTVDRPIDSSPALDATLPSQGGSQETQEGTLLGTPAYFAPEQVAGQLPDEKTEIFAAGVLVYEMVAGKNPFSGAGADSMESLFGRILECRPEPPDVPEPLRGTIMTALALEAKDRFADMASFAAALRAARDELFAPPRRRRWPWMIAAALVAALVTAGAVWRLTRSAPVSPADRYLEQAVRNYDVFNNDLANSNLRAAMKIAPDDPRPHAYLVLMGYASETERKTAAAEASRLAAHASRARDRALVDAAAALMTEGPAAARGKVHGGQPDRELAFWEAELAYRANQFDDAAAGYHTLLASPLKRFRGRIFDHYVACLLYRDRIPEAVEIGEAYAREYPGEADAVGVQATVYAVAGRLDDALRLAEEARGFAENEDTLAGLAKVRVLRGEFHEAEALYRRAIELAPVTRRPLRRAALAAILLMNNRVDDARAVVTPCLPGGEEVPQRTASVCLFVAGLADPARIPEILPELERRAHLAPPSVPYGRPDALAQILRARQIVAEGDDANDGSVAQAEQLLAGADDIYVTYHLPFLSSYVPRFRAQLRILVDDYKGAAEVLAAPLAARPADAAALLQLAGAQAAAGDRAQGLRTLDRLAKAWPTADPDSFVMHRAGELRARLTTL